jgi:hypothetical protein
VAGAWLFRQVELRLGSSLGGASYSVLRRGNVREIVKGIIVAWPRGVPNIRLISRWVELG